MMEAILSMKTLLDLGMLGVILIVLFWVLKFATTKWTAMDDHGNLRCMMDPVMRDRIKDIHNYTEDVQVQIAQGEFKCAWRGRDEVRDMMHLLERNAAATEALTVELRLTRNGGSKK